MWNHAIVFLNLYENHGVIFIFVGNLTYNFPYKNLESKCEIIVRKQNLVHIILIRFFEWHETYVSDNVTSNSGA